MMPPLTKLDVPPLDLLNHVSAGYGGLSYQERHYLWLGAAKMFRVLPPVTGEFELCLRWRRLGVAEDVASVSLTLRGSHLWLDWDLALSFLGHDIEVKMAYESLLSSLGRPLIAYDIGACYGLDTIFLAANGARVVSIEPNSSCHDYLRRACARNGLSIRMRHAAMGAGSGLTNLVYPLRDAWLGTCRSEMAAQLAKRFSDDIRYEHVVVETLDHVVAEEGLAPDLIKIDTEGSELEVLQGGWETLRTSQPAIVFESLDPSDRDDLFTFLARARYTLHALRSESVPWSAALRRSEFSGEGPCCNFIALPC